MGTAAGIEVGPKIQVLRQDAIERNRPKMSFDVVEVGFLETGMVGAKDVGRVRGQKDRLVIAGRDLPPVGQLLIPIGHFVAIVGIERGLVGVFMVDLPPIPLVPRPVGPGGGVAFEDFQLVLMADSGDFGQSAKDPLKNGNIVPTEVETREDDSIDVFFP